MASRLITKFVPLEIVASILGHNDTSMVKKHNGKIISEDRPNVAQIVSDIIGKEYGLKVTKRDYK